jgi:hypothetical protein
MAQLVDAACWRRRRGGICRPRIAGYVPAWRRLHSAEPFATFDRRVYAPLCLALGAGFITILLRGSP